MSDISDAIGLELLSNIVGIKVVGEDFSEVSENLPQSLLILCEGNTANQATLPDKKFKITSAKQAGEKCGYGSPAYLIARILFPPMGGGGIGGIPVYIHPQPEAGGAQAQVYEITPTGVATKSGTHYVYIGGRKGMEGQFYKLDIVEGDTTSDITGKITDALSNVLGCPVTVTDDDYVNTLTTKWKGKTAAGLNVRIDTGDDDLGITYAVASTQTGSGVPSISTAMEELGNDWWTFILNSYGTEDDIVSTLELTNGKPDPENPTGRYSGIVMRPFIALTGSVSDDDSAFTDDDDRKDEVTIALCPAPNSEGLAMEAAANVALLECRKAQDKPHGDIQNMKYPDMPLPAPSDSLGTMTEYLSRDEIMKKGSSTADIVSGNYVMKDFITTYHPVGEVPPFFRYVRDLVLDQNVIFRYQMEEARYVLDKTIVGDDDDVDVDDCIKPKQWKAILINKFEEWTKAALISDAKFSADSLKVQLSPTNPNRFNTTFKGKRTGFVRQSSSTYSVGFNFGK